MHTGEIWTEKTSVEESDSSTDAIRLLQYLDNDEWLVEYGVWDEDDKIFTSERDFANDAASETSDSEEDVEDAINEVYDEEEFEDILTGSEIFQDYTRVQ